MESTASSTTSIPAGSPRGSIKLNGDLAIFVEAYKFKSEIHTTSHTKTISNSKDSDAFFVRADGTIGKCHVIFKWLVQLFTCCSKKLTFDTTKVYKNIEDFQNHIETFEGTEAETLMQKINRALKLINPNYVEIQTNEDGNQFVEL